MKTLFLGSVVERSGKSMVTLGLAKNYPGRVGYYKPFKEVLMTSGEAVVDQDAYLMRRALNLPLSEAELSPNTYDVFDPVSMDTILDGYRKASQDAELMLVEGTRDITTGCMGSVSGMAIAKAVGASVILVSTAQLPALDKICMLREVMDRYDIPFNGVILNTADDPDVRRLLERKGIEVMGCIPPIKELKTFRVSEVVDALGADIIDIVVPKNMDRVVERVMIGAMTPEVALQHMRRVSRKAIVTGGDRGDIQMAALSTDTSCLVLTGGMYPNKAVITRAHEIGVPILLTRYNTLEAAEMIDHLIARIDPSDSEKIDLIAAAVKRYVDLDAVFG